MVSNPPWTETEIMVEQSEMVDAQTDLLSDPHPCRHIVYPYDDEEKAINAVALFAGSGLSKGESVVLIMADSRCEPIKERLAQAGFNLSAWLGSGKLECLSAENIFEKFMPGGALDERLIKDALGGVITRAKACSLTGKVRVFGEMVSLLLAQNHVSAAEQLEELWNQVIATHSISLFCTYRLLGTGFKTLPESLALMHSHTLPDCGPCY